MTAPAVFFRHFSCQKKKKKNVTFSFLVVFCQKMPFRRFRGYFFFFFFFFLISRVYVYIYKFFSAF